MRQRIRHVMTYLACSLKERGSEWKAVKTEMFRNVYFDNKKGSFVTIKVQTEMNFENH